MASKEINEATTDDINYDDYRAIKAAAKIRENELILSIIGSFNRTGGDLYDIESK